MKFPLIVIVVLMETASASWASQEAQAKYRSISHEVYNAQAQDTWRPRTGKTEIERAINDLHDLVNATVQEALSAPAPSSASVEKAIDDLQGDSQLLAGRLTDWERKNPFADLSKVDGLPTLVTAFGILSGGYGIPNVSSHIQFYSQIAGSWKLQKEVGSEFNQRRFSVARVRSASPNEVCYLAWGRVIGDTGTRLLVKLYGFDGWNVRTISERSDLHGGTVNISDGQVILKYDEAAQPGELDYHRRITETVRVGAAGLERVGLSYSPEAQ